MHIETMPQVTGLSQSQYCRPQTSLSLQRGRS